MLGYRLGVPPERNEPWRSPRVIRVFRESLFQHRFFVKHAADLKYAMHYENDDCPWREHLDKGPDHRKFFTNVERMPNKPIRPMRNQSPRLRHDAKCPTEPAQHDKGR